MKGSDLPLGLGKDINVDGQKWPQSPQCLDSRSVRAIHLADVIIFHCSTLLFL